LIFSEFLKNDFKLFIRPKIKKKHEYLIDDIVSGIRVELEDSKCEMDIGVLISSDL
jgi:hypothetical protein